jgi:hypothetical protein
MTIQEAAQQARQLSKTGEYLLVQTAQSFEGQVLISHSVHLDGHSSVVQPGFAACFAELTARLTQAMAVCCAWCGLDMGSKDGQEGISHGICRACLRRHFPDFPSAAP